MFTDWLTTPVPLYYKGYNTLALKGSVVAIVVFLELKVLLCPKRVRPGLNWVLMNCYWTFGEFPTFLGDYYWGGVISCKTVAYWFSCFCIAKFYTAVSLIWPIILAISLPMFSFSFRKLFISVTSGLLKLSTVIFKLWISWYMVYGWVSIEPELFKLELEVLFGSSLNYRIRVASCEAVVLCFFSS